MSSLSECRNLLRQICKADSGIEKPDVYYAEVVSVNIPARTCACTLISGTSAVPLDTVNLMSGVNDGLLRVPTIGSTVYILSTPNVLPWVSVFGQLDQIIYIVGDTEFSMVNGTAMMQQGDMTVTLSEGKINIKNGSKNYTTIFQNLVNHLIQMQVDTGTGPAFLDPSTVSNLNQDLSDFNALMA